MAEFVHLETYHWSGGTAVAERMPYTIDPGHVPPSFSHTWALDVMAVSEFRLVFDGLLLARHLADRFSVLDADGQVVARFTSPGDVDQLAVPVSPPVAAGAATRL